MLNRFRQFMGLFLNDCYLFPVIGHQACSQQFFVFVGGGGGGGEGCAKGARVDQAIKCIYLFFA